LAHGKIIGLGILLRVIDKATGPAGRIARQFKTTKYSAEQLGRGMQKLGVGMMVAGGAMTAFNIKALSSTFGTQKALGELASLGIKDLDLMGRKAQEISNQYAGITSTQFVTAAYDIKSAISSLSDSAVADYTRLAAITAKATKGSVEQMGDLYATAYGIYKELFPKMSDSRFAENLSGAIATTVREFKMTGPKIAEYVSLLGASATKQKVSLPEQFAIGGMLGATMSGSEIATKYGAFLKQPVKAAKKLGLAFTDSNNRLLPMADILDRIRGKFGSYIDAVEKGQLVEAFGRIEGVKLVELLIGKTDELRRKTDIVAQAMGQGAKVAIDMANVINRPIGEKWILFKQQVHNVMEVLGELLIPMAMRVINKFSGIAIAIQKWAQAHPGLTKFAMILSAIGGFVLVVLGGLIALGGTVLIAAVSFSGLAMILPIIQAGLLGIAAAGSALMANPVLLAISALVVGAYLLIFHWGKVKSFMSNVFNEIANLLTFFASVMWSGGKNIIISLWEGIKSEAMKPVNAVTDLVQGIRDLLPFSPVKMGPLRGLDKSGIEIVNQLRRGLESAKPALEKTANDLLKAVQYPLADLTATPFSFYWKGYNIKLGAIANMPLPLDQLLPNEGGVESSLSGRDTGIDGGLSGVGGGMGGMGGGIVSYKTQHFEKGSVVLNVANLNWESFKGMVGRAVDELTGEAN
jgi:TP901 family phage tail tape measure protein